MTETLILLNGGLTAFLLVRGLWKRAGYLEVPFLSALIYAIWYLPQAFVLLDDTTLQESSLDRVLAMSLLCLIAVWAGWRDGIKIPARGGMSAEVRLDHLVLPTILLTLFAVLMRVAILAQPDEVRASGQWTGIITILAFFAQVGIVSLVLSFVLALRRRSIVTMALLGVNLMLYAAPLLIYFRRANTFEFVFCILLVLFFVKGKAIPRALVIAGLVVGFLYVNGVGDLRALSGGYSLNEAGKIEARIPTLEEVMGIDWFGIDRFRQARYISETRNAVVYMQSIEDQSAIGLGAALWNLLVHAYVPGQIVGFDFKQSLIIGDSLRSLALRSTGFEAHTGTTSTGFTLPYYDFWFFGALVYFFVTRILARHFARAYAGSVKSLAVYAVLLPLSILAITHYGYYVLVYAPLPLCAVWLAFWYARHAPDRLQTSQRFSVRFGTNMLRSGAKSPGNN